MYILDQIVGLMVANKWSSTFTLSSGFFFLFVATPDTCRGILSLKPTHLLNEQVQE